MGTVYEAFQESMKRKVALKVLDTGLLPSDRDITRFEREAWIGGRLNHPNIVKVFAQGATERSRYIAMELVEGLSLHDEIEAARQRQPEGRASASSWSRGRIRKIVELFVGVADALQHVHDQGVVHRDIKPLNLLLTKDRSRLLLTDFGLARDIDTTRVTRRGDFLGTIRYMSPEQLLASRVKVDHRSDLYSLGVSLYEAVTLALPYSGDSEEAYLTAISMKDPLPASKCNRAVPRDLETVLMECLERDPERRYPSALELKRDLERFLRGRPVRARRPGLIRRARSFAGRHGTTLGVVATAVLVVAAGSTWLFRHRLEQRDIERIAWTLEQCIVKGANPDRLQPDWARLEDKLWTLVENRLDRRIDVLAHRAACQIRVDIPRFGLTSANPEWGIAFAGPGCGLRRDKVLERDYMCAAEVEGSWDGDEWRVMQSAVWESGYGFVARAGFGNFLSPERWAAAPHQLDLRARIVLPDEIDRWKEEIGFVGKVGSLADDHPRIWDLPKRYDETRKFGKFEVVLFDEFPDDFPRAVRTDEIPDDVREPLRIERVRIVRVDLPDGDGNGFVFSEDENDRRCVPEDPSWRSGLIAQFDLIGSLDTGASIPVAAEGVLTIESMEALTFVVVWGEGIGEVVGEASELDMLFSALFRAEGSVKSETSVPLGDAPGLGTAGPFQRLASTLPDGNHDGRLKLLPSPEIARRTRRFIRYVGDPVEMPVAVEIETLTGTMRHFDRCP